MILLSKIGGITMPELPEVETIRRIVEPQVADRTIRAVRLLQEQVIAHPAPDAFVRLLSGQTITSYNGTMN